MGIKAPDKAFTIAKAGKRSRIPDDFDNVLPDRESSAPGTADIGKEHPAETGTGLATGESSSTNPLEQDVGVASPAPGASGAASPMEGDGGDAPK